jgi:23S rRNA (pseudouridine1915-N3)-methyltransferase
VGDRAALTRVKIVIAAVGKAKRSPEAELVEDYLKKTRWDITFKEIPDAPAGLPSEQRRALEAERILALMDNDTRLIALDAMGEQLSSPQFAGLVTQAQLDRAKRLLFAIGGQDGLAPSLLGEAKRVVAFGMATWPHKLVRVMLAEQLYRAYTITIGHPYHTGH